MTLRKKLVTSFCVPPFRPARYCFFHRHRRQGWRVRSAAKDPGVRAAAADAGTPLSTLSANQVAFFQDGSTRFNAVDSVGGTIAGEPDAGLGPTFNSNSCGNCHAQPAIGGTSPSTNPQIAAATDSGATNSIPISSLPAARCAKRGSPFCSMPTAAESNPRWRCPRSFHHRRPDRRARLHMAQPNFPQMEQLRNLIFRIPTPTFGRGMIENIPDATIHANMNANPAA